MDKSFFGKLRGYLRFYLSHAGSKLFLVSALILCSGMFDGVGISMMLPLLNYQQSSAEANDLTRLVRSTLESLGVEPTLTVLLALIFFAFLLKGIFFFLQGVVVSKITTDLTKRLRIKFCEMSAAMRYSHFVDQSAGYINNIIVTEVGRGIFGFTKLCEILVQLIFILVYTGATLLLNWRMTLISYLVFAAIVFGMRSLSRLPIILSRLVTVRNSELQAVLIQVLNNFKYLKATNRFGSLNDRLSGLIAENQNYLFKDNVLHLVPASLLEPLSILFLSVVITYQVGYLGRSLSEVFVLILFFYRTFQRMFSLRVEWQRFLTYTGGIEVLEKAEREFEQNREENGTTVLSGVREGIVLSHVGFSFGSRQILDDVSITVPKNKITGIVGESGAGKTTVFDMITGLLTPRCGTISIDGIPYEDLDRRSLRNLIGYVTQEPVIFNDSIANNISFWDGDPRDPAVREQIEQAARAANCEDFIRHAENGYQTLIGDRGVRLSVGQRQRIAIARELYKGTPLLALDEATSALDTESEALVQESIGRLAGSKTIVIVAHRLSTVRNCDLIYVLSQGRVVESGSFANLYADENSRFHKMCKSQNV